MNNQDLSIAIVDTISTITPRRQRPGHKAWKRSEPHTGDECYSGAGAFASDVRSAWPAGVALRCGTDVYHSHIWDF